MPLSWFIFARFIHIVYTFYLREKADVLEGAVLHEEEQEHNYFLKRATHLWF